MPCWVYDVAHTQLSLRLLQGRGTCRLHDSCAFDSKPGLVFNSLALIQGSEFLAARWCAQATTPAGTPGGAKSAPGGGLRLAGRPRGEELPGGCRTAQYITSQAMVPCSPCTDLAAWPKCRLRPCLPSLLPSFLRLCFVLRSFGSCWCWGTHAGS